MTGIARAFAPRAIFASALFVGSLVGLRPALAQSQGAPQGTTPVSISIPRLGQSAPVVGLGLEDDGALAAPTDPDTVGWYELGAGVGVPGNAIFDGHVDWAGRLRAFGLLKLLAPGDLVEVTDDQGNVLRYDVTWNETVDAVDAPVDDIYAQGPDEEITLITCGGEFDHVTRQYLSRVVVRAQREAQDAANGDPTPQPDSTDQ